MALSKASSKFIGKNSGQSQKPTGYARVAWVVDTPGFLWSHRPDVEICFSPIQVLNRIETVKKYKAHLPQVKPLGSK